MHAHASFPAADTTPVDPLAWVTVADPYGKVGVDSTPSAACAQLTPNGGYTFTGAVKSGLQWYCTGTGNGHDPSVGFPNLPVSVRCAAGATFNPATDKCVAAACPATADLESSSCTCKAQFRENAAHNGCDVKQTSRAFLPFQGASGVSPSQWITVNTSYGQYVGATPSSACSQFPANNGYTFTGAVKNASGWFCTGTGNGHDPSVGFSNLPVSPICPSGTTFDLASDRCFAGQQCPANATYDAASNTCGCALGYQVARNGTACEAPPLPPGAAYGSQNSCPREDGSEVGKPILPGTGAKAKVQVDYVDPAGRGPDVVRTYLSNVRDAVVPMGIGWRLGLLHVLRSTSTKAVITLGDGYVITFTRANTSSPWAAVGAADTLTISGTQWRIKDSRNDDVYLFEPAGTGTDYAKSVTQRNGWVTSYAYTNGQLTQVVNPFGRTLSLVYAPSGLLKSITAPDGQLIQYAYDTANRLTSVTYADGAVR
ncbi:RHS repeat domain-containing protein, partial [Ramlibacter humi]